MEESLTPGVSAQWYKQSSLRAKNPRERKRERQPETKDRLLPSDLGSNTPLRRCRSHRPTLARCGNRRYKRLTSGGRGHWETSWRMQASRSSNLLNPKAKLRQRQTNTAPQAGVFLYSCKNIHKSLILYCKDKKGNIHKEESVIIHKQCQ